MDAIDITARLVGAFYVLGGVLGLRAVAMDSFLDQAIASIGMTRPDPKERLRQWAMGAMVAVTGTAGLSLLLLSGWAAWLFLLNLALQAGWLLWAGRQFPPRDADEALGRRRVTNAALIWTVATAMVLWLRRQDRLAALTDLWTAGGVLLGGVAMGGWLLRQLMWKPSRRLPFGEEPDGQPVVQPRPERVRLESAYGYQSLRDADTGYGVDLAAHLPPDLAGRLLDWENAFHDAVDPYEPESGPAFDEAQARAHAAEGRAIAEALKAEFGSANVEVVIPEV